jgi:hypothetical protein
MRQLWSAWPVRHPPTADIETLLGALVAEVELIVVGGAAAVIHGAPITTQDFDIVPQQHVGSRHQAVDWAGA